MTACVLLIDLLISALKKIFGRTLEEEDFLSYLREFKSSDLKRLSTDTLDIFGYKASKNLIILFCGIVICLALIEHLPDNDKGGYLNYISKSQFLLIIHAIFSLWVLDVCIPKLIFHLIN